MTKRILIFGTYPIINPQHGGQHRTAALLKEYGKKFNAKYVALYRRTFYPDAGTDDIAIPEPTGHQSLLDIYTSDVQIGKKAYEDDDTREKLESLIRTYNPDIIHVEQVFPYFGLAALLKKINWGGKLVYGSQNVEYELKNEILKHPSIAKIDRDEIVREIKNTELLFTKVADLVVACTDSDAALYKNHGAKKVVVAKNGIVERRISETSVSQWRSRFARQGITKPVLYIGSAHPPNVTGYLKMIGFGLGFLPADAQLMFLGGVSDILRQELEKQPNYIQATAILRANFLGRVSEDDLGALLTLADTILLPITEGGGSNLKTAEAILADKKIVGTSHAFRSYEAYLDLPNLIVADSKNAFHSAATELVGSPKQPRSPEQKLLATKVTWDYTLADLINEVEKL